MSTTTDNTNGADVSKEHATETIDPKILEEAGELSIKDKDGNELPFSSLFADKSPEERQLIVFVRHFFCGSCEDYIKALTKDLHPDVLSKHNITLTIIGCGDSQFIQSYAERTGCLYPMYCDPTQALYKKLSMVKTLAGSGNKASYHQRSFANIVAVSMWNALKSAPSVLQGKAGPSDQNGGELLFQHGKLQWCHIMQNTADHTSTAELKSILSLQ